MTRRPRHLSAVPDLPPEADDVVHELRRVRCECRVCGVHVVAHMCFTVAGNCPNCGSYDLQPLRPSSAR